MWAYLLRTGRIEPADTLLSVLGDYFSLATWYASFSGIKVEFSVDLTLDEIEVSSGSATV